MRSARQSAIRLLQLMMVACVVLPILLFGFASWLNYRHENAVADDRIERSLDILHEHTLKVVQTVERAIAEVDEIVRVTPARSFRASSRKCRPTSMCATGISSRRRRPAMPEPMSAMCSRRG